MIFRAFAGKISKNLNRRVLTFFMPDKPVELIKIVSLINKSLLICKNLKMDVVCCTLEKIQSPMPNVQCLTSNDFPHTTERERNF